MQVVSEGGKIESLGKGDSEVALPDARPVAVRSGSPGLVEVQHVGPLELRMRSRQQCPFDAPIIEHDAADEDVISDRRPLIISIHHDGHNHIPSIIAEWSTEEIRSLSIVSNPHGSEGRGSQDRAGGSSETEDGLAVFVGVEAEDVELAAGGVGGGVSDLDAVVELEEDAGG